VILRAGLIRATALTRATPKPSSRERLEANLDSFDLAGKRAVISIDLGSAVVEPVQSALLIELAEFLITKAQLIRVDLAIHLPNGGLEWSLSNLIGLAGALGDKYPACHDELTPEIRSA